uniref:Uncharacterized protein n=1 Tax=Panagrolaimus superbus TaxID=310955 RepID=A0A914ZEH0_9BILA
MFLFSTDKGEVVLERVTVKNDGGTALSFTNVIEKFAGACTLEYHFDDETLKQTSKADFDRFWTLPRFASNIQLIGLSEECDVDSYLNYLKKFKIRGYEQPPCIELYYRFEISDEYKARLESIADETIAIKRFETYPPFVCFPGLGILKFSTLHSAFCNNY